MTAQPPYDDGRQCRQVSCQLLRLCAEKTNSWGGHPKASEFQADSSEVLEAWLKPRGHAHFDWLVRIEWVTRARDGKLHPAG
jgi:hypothetical protein